MEGCKKFKKRTEFIGLREIFQTLIAGTESYKGSFFLQTIRDWNKPLILRFPLPKLQDCAVN